MSRSRPHGLLGRGPAALSACSNARRASRAALALAGSALVLLPAQAAARTIVGTVAPDRLVGSSPEGDLIFGGGADTLIGGPGNDIIYGVRSGNQIDGGQGNNYIEGGTGDDKITAGDGTNTVYGGSGHDEIRLGNGNNYVDPGGAPDVVRLGHGNNVVNMGSGGTDLQIGNGNNTIYYTQGADTIELGTGVNTIYLASVWGLAKLDCGGNPLTKVFVNTKKDKDLYAYGKVSSEGKIKNCPNVEQFVGARPIQSRRASEWESFNLVGDDGRDKLFGGHGGGTIDGKGGDNVLWADWVQSTGGDAARSKTTRISADHGNNIVYGGRGTNIINLGDGRNFVRGGAWHNTINVGAGSNTIRLQGKGNNTINIRGGSAYVESFANGPAPRINCLNGARGVVVHGIRKPKTNCQTVAKAKSKRGMALQVSGIEQFPDSDFIVDGQLLPGNPSGIPRPTPTA